MANQYGLAHVTHNDPRAVADIYDFPDGAAAVEMLHPGVGSTLESGRTPHAITLEIWGAGAPSTNYNNAPNGSKYNDVTNAAIYIKTGMPGSGTGGTWTTVNS